MNERRESDRPIVPRKPANNGGPAASSAERAEGRGLAKGKPLRPTQSIGRRAAPGWQSALKRIRHAVRQDKDASLSRREAARQDPRQEPGAVIPLAGICGGGAGQPASLLRTIGRSARWLKRPDNRREGR